MADTPSAAEYHYPHFPDCRGHLAPVTPDDELTPDLLATARLAASIAGWPAHVYPSTWYASRWMGTASLVTFAAVGAFPPDDAQTVVPLVTVLPDGYYGRHEELLAHLLTATVVTKRH
jgi:hypothetical protein